MRKFLATLFKGLFKLSFFRKRFFGFHKKLFAPKNLFKNVVLPVNYHGLSIELKIDDWIQEKLYFLGEYEAAELKSIEQFLSKDSVFIDLGGNIGLYSLFASTKIDTSGKIIAFEPFSLNHQAFLKSKNDNGLDQIELIKKAVGETSGKLTLYYDESEKNRGMVSSKPQDYGTKEEVEMLAIDQYLESNTPPKIDLIKIDLEGHEYPALLGMKKTLTHFKPPILIEILNNQDEQSQDFLLNLGYEKFFIDDTGNLSKTESNPDRRNYLFVFPN